MRRVSPQQRSRQQQIALASMGDVCEVLALTTAAANSRGYPVEGYAPPVATACGFSDDGGEEVQSESAQIVITDAALRLPLGTTITNRDRVRLTHRGEAALAVPLMFAVVGPIRRGRTAIRVRLRTITEQHNGD